MIDINPLHHFDSVRFKDIASGYITTEILSVSRSEDDERTTFSLILEHLTEPQEFRFPFSDEDFAHYRAIVPGEFCYAAYDREVEVGLAIAEPQTWNRVLWVWDFHVIHTHRGRGIGRSLMTALVEQARSAGLRAIVCETQNTNVPAIRFYRAMGFSLEGVDISYYTNEDMLPGRTVAVFMKLRLE